MQEIEIYPNSDINFSIAEIGGQKFVRVHLPDSVAQTTVTLGFTLPTFAAFADHLEMTATALITDPEAFKNGG